MDKKPMKKDSNLILLKQLGRLKKGKQILFCGITFTTIFLKFGMLVYCKSVFISCHGKCLHFNMEFIYKNELKRGVGSG